MQFPEMEEVLLKNAQVKKEAHLMKKNQVEKTSPIFNRIREHFGSNIINTGTSTRFVRFKLY